MEKWTATQTIIASFLSLVIVLLFKYALGFYLWQEIAVAIFGLPKLTFWQYFWTLQLISIIIPTRSSSSTNLPNLDE